MGIPLEQYEKIQDYLDGRMTPQQEKDFLILVKTDIFLKENLEFEKQSRQNLGSLLDKKNVFEKERAYNESNKNFGDDEAIKSLIKKAGSEWEEENKQILQPLADNNIFIKRGHKKAKVINLQSWIKIATAACIVIAIISVIWFIRNPSSKELVKNHENPVIPKDSINDIAKAIPNDSIKNIKPHAHQINYAALFKKYYAKDTAVTAMPELLAMIPEKYKNDDYSFREINLDKIPLTRGPSYDINSRQNVLQLGHYYQGLSYIETNDDKKAIEKLQWVIENPGNAKTKVKAQWYIALICLKNGQNKKAHLLLFSLSKNESANPYNIKAQEILLAMDKIRNAH